MESTLLSPTEWLNIIAYSNLFLSTNSTKSYRKEGSFQLHLRINQEKDFIKFGYCLQFCCRRRNTLLINSRFSPINLLLDQQTICLSHLYYQENILIYIFHWPCNIKSWLTHGVGIYLKICIWHWTNQQKSIKIDIFYSQSGYQHQTTTNERKKKEIQDYFPGSLYDKKTLKFVFSSYCVN